MPDLVQHQREAVEFGRTHLRWINISGYGTGKTAPAAFWLRDLVPAHRVLIVCTGAKVEDWVANVRAWGREWWRVATLGGDRVTKRWQRWQAFRTPHHVAVVNYEGLQIFGKSLLNYDVVLIDELHRAKNAISDVSRALAALGEHALYVHGMTGCPVLENLDDLYGVLRPVRPEMFGPSLDRFRDLWFTYESEWKCPQCEDVVQVGGPKVKCPKCDVVASRMYPKWRPRPIAKFFLPAAVHAISFCRTKDQIPYAWPAEIDQPRIVTRLHPKVRRLMNAIAKEVNILLLGSVIRPADIRARMQKMLCLSSGWIYGHGRRAIHVARHNPKAIAVEEQLEHLRGRGQVVVWAVRPPDFEIVGRAMTRLGMTYACVQGSTRKSHRPDLLLDFNAGHREGLIAHPLCLAEGVDMPAHHALYFSRTWSHAEYDQSRGRLVRMFQQKDRVTYRQICAEGLDEAVVDILEGPKRDLLREVMRVRELPISVAERNRRSARHGSELRVPSST